MSGIELKNSESKNRKQNFKLLICLISSNFLFFILFSFFGSESPKNVSEKMATRIFHAGYQRLKLNISSHVAYADSDSEIPISLYSPSKTLIISKAYLHPHLKKEVSSSDFKSEKNEDEFLVEIKEDQIAKLMTHQGEVLSAYPQVAEVKNSTNNFKEGESYEINF